VQTVCTVAPLRILVAGDENLTAQLRSHVGSDQHEWHFSSGLRRGNVLATADGSEPDIVIGTGGAGLEDASLLGSARDRFPGVVRVLLTNETDRYSVIDGEGLVQMCLSAPFTAGQLEATIARAEKLRELLSDEGMRGLIGRIRSVPTLPETYRKVVSELESGVTSVSRVGEIISQDAGMTAKLLQMANSAYFAARREIADPTKAVVQVGLDVTRALVLSAGVFSSVKVKLRHREIVSLWSHCLDTSLLARRIASLESSDQAFVECAFTGALLHDFGKLILAANLPEEYSAVLAEAESAGEALHIVEKRTLGSTHASVGAYIAGLWGLPRGVVCAVARHHGPFDGCCDPLYAAGIVHVADMLDHERRSVAEERHVELDPVLMADATFTARVERWRSLREATDFGGGH